MKNKKKLILPLVLAVLLIIYGLTTLATRQVVTDDEAVTTTPSVTNVHSAPGLTAFTINRGDTSFRFAHDESGWRLAGEPLPINPFVLSQMAFTASNVMAAQIIEAAEALPLSIYGLDTPIFIEVEAEQNFTLAIGAPTPSGLAYYVMVSGSNNVYVVNNFYLDQFFGSLESFLEVRLQPLDFTQLNRIEIENRFGRIVLALNPRTDDRLWTSWLMTEPYVNAMIDSFNTEQAFLQYWLQRFTFMRQNMRVRPNMAEFGLANPQGRITFSTHNGESISLALGDVAQTDVAYWVRANDEDIIFTLDSETVEAALNLRPFDVISRFVALYNIDLIESIEFTYQNSHFRGVINGVLYEAGTTFSLNNITLTEAAFKEMYTGFLAVFYEGTAPLSGNEVVATMVYNFRDGTRRLIEFLPGAQAGFYAVRIDGEVRWPFVVGSYQLARLLSAMQRLVN